MLFYFGYQTHAHAFTHTHTHIHKTLALPKKTWEREREREKGEYIGVPTIYVSEHQLSNGSGDTSWKVNREKKKKKKKGLFAFNFDWIQKVRKKSSVAQPKNEQKTLKTDFVKCLFEVTCVFLLRFDFVLFCVDKKCWNVERHQRLDVVAIAQCHRRRCRRSGTEEAGPPVESGTREIRSLFLRVSAGKITFKMSNIKMYLKAFVVVNSYVGSKVMSSNPG